MKLIKNKSVFRIVIWNLKIKLDQDQKQIRRKKFNTYESLNGLYEGQELKLNAYKNEIFPLKST